MRTQEVVQILRTFKLGSACFWQRRVGRGAKHQLPKCRRSCSHITNFCAPEGTTEEKGRLPLSLNTPQISWVLRKSGLFVCFFFNVLILQCSSLSYFRVLFSNLDLDDSYSLERRVRNAHLMNTELELPALRYFAHPLGKQHSRAAAGRGLESTCLSWASELLFS